MGDLLAGAASFLLDGPLLALIALVVMIVFGMFCYGWGRRAAFREIDDARAKVRSARARAAAERVAGLVPGQRDGAE